MSYRGWISGFEVQYVSSSQVKVRAGGCDIPSLPTGYDGSAGLNAETTLTPTLSASSWHYVYAFANATTHTVNFEVSTVAPVVYFGTARHNTGDATSRYIGAFRTDASSNILRFHRSGEFVRYVADQDATLRVLNSGSATTATTFSAANLMPPSARLAFVAMRCVYGSATVNAYLGAPGDGMNVAAGESQLTVTSLSDSTRSYAYGPVETDASQQMRYANSVSGASTHVDILGYWEER